MVRAWLQDGYDHPTSWIMGRAISPNYFFGIVPRALPEAGMARVVGAWAMTKFMRLS